MRESSIFSVEQHQPRIHYNVLETMPLKSLARICSGIVACFFGWEALVILPDLFNPFECSLSEVGCFLNTPEIETVFLALDAMVRKYELRI